MPEKWIFKDGHRGYVPISQPLNGPTSLRDQDRSEQISSHIPADLSLLLLLILPE